MASNRRPPLYEDPSLDGIHPRIGCLSTQDDEGKFPGGSLCYLGHRPDEGATGRTLDPFLTDVSLKTETPAYGRRSPPDLCPRISQPRHERREMSAAS